MIFKNKSEKLLDKIKKMWYNTTTINNADKPLHKERKKKMKLNVVNEVPEINVTVQESSDGGFSILVAKKAQGKPLGSFKPGSVVKLGNREYIVLDHSAETTAVITKEFAESMEFGKDGDYTKSNVRKYCEGKFYEELAKAVGKENIIEHTVKLVADDGTGKKNTIKANVSILTTELYRRYREFLPKYGKWWWTATRVSADDSLGYARSVCCVGSLGFLNWYGSDFCFGVRPFCILNSSILVS